MQTHFLLEISVEGAAAAMAAERGRAGRIELCSNAQVGGTTPGADLLRSIRGQVSLPIFTMVRPRGGNFLYSDGEFAEMQGDVDTAKEMGMDGIVLGLLDASGEVDVERSRKLVDRARPLPVTFHRAFDECKDLRKSLEDVIRTGATRLLTSGGKQTAPEALDILGDLVRIAGERIVVMPGSGIVAANIQEVVKKSGALEFHAGLSSVVANPVEDLQAFEEEVRRIVEALGESGAKK